VLHGLALGLFEPKTSNSTDTTLFVTLVETPADHPLREQQFTEAPIAEANELQKDSAADPFPEPKPKIPDNDLNQTNALPYQEIFYKSSELDEQPYPLKPVNPSHPDDGIGITGWVRLLLLIDDSGKLVQSSVISSEAPESLHEAALNAFLEIPFSPGKREGRPVNSRMVIKVTFDKKIH
jgi:protein TonB